MSWEAWGWKRPDGSFVVDSSLMSEAWAWQIALGWPDAMEIEAAKLSGWVVAKFSVNEETRMEIIVNGGKRVVDAASITYEDVVKLAGLDPKRIYSITYCALRAGDEQREGSLRPGREMTIEHGMRFYIGDTSNA